MNEENKPKVFKPKMRITTLDENGVYLSDRLVDAYTELYAGPKEQHKGPIRLEITLTNQEDVTSFKNYIDQLVGNLPIKAPTAGRGRPANGSSKELDTPREDILVKVEEMVNQGKNQTEVIKYLRDLGFVFILTEDLLYYFPDFPFKVKDIGEPNQGGQYLNSYSWCIRRIRKGKDPKTDKFDPMIMFGFSIIKGPSRKVVPYLYKERKNPLKVIPPKKALSFSDVEFTKYPAWMNQDERLKFSFEIRQLILNKDKKPSKFFHRWYQDVKFPDSIKSQMEEAIMRK